MRLLITAIILITLGCTEHSNDFGHRVSGPGYEGIIVTKTSESKFIPEGIWVPDRVQIAMIENSLPGYVASEIRLWSQKNPPLPPLSEYKRQYLGIIESRHKLIRIILYHNSLVGSGEWLRDMGISGGGNKVLQAIYDKDLRKFVHFHPNY
jgi:hypothetical protein